MNQAGTIEEDELGNDSSLICRQKSDKGGDEAANMNSQVSWSSTKNTALFSGLLETKGIYRQEN